MRGRREFFRSSRKSLAIISLFVALASVDFAYSEDVRDHHPSGPDAESNENRQEGNSPQNPPAKTEGIQSFDEQKGTNQSEEKGRNDDADTFKLAIEKFADEADWSSVLISVVALLVSIVSAYYARRTYHLSLRPRLKAMQFVFDIRAGNGEGHFLVENEGGEAAEIKIYKCTVLLPDRNLPQVHPARGDVRNMWHRKKRKSGHRLEPPISPGGVRDIYFSSNEALTIDQVDQINSGNATLYVIGYIHYKGYSKTIYWTQFCRRYSASKERFETEAYEDWEYRS